MPGRRHSLSVSATIAVASPFCTCRGAVAPMCPPVGNGRSFGRCRMLTARTIRPRRRPDKGRRNPAPGGVCAHSLQTGRRGVKAAPCLLVCGTGDDGLPGGRPFVRHVSHLRPVCRGRTDRLRPHAFLSPPLHHGRSIGTDSAPPRHGFRPGRRPGADRLLARVPSGMRYTAPCGCSHAGENDGAFYTAPDIRRGPRVPDGAVRESGFCSIEAGPLRRHDRNRFRCRRRQDFAKVAGMTLFRVRIHASRHTGACQKDRADWRIAPVAVRDG